MPDDTGPGLKYAALIFSPPSGPSDPYAMQTGVETFVGKVTALIPPSQLEHWREWLGSIAWRRMEGAGRIAVERLLPRPGP